MRHNQNSRHMRGRRSNNHGGGGNHQQRRVNPRVQTFDSNGPDVRIRGNAFQITEKYQSLARDAAAGGDRVLAESYLQHAEHYQRMINEANEDFNNRQQQNNQQQGQQQNGNNGSGNESENGDGNGNGKGGDQDHVDMGSQPQPPMDDLDQGFLVGPRGGNGKGNGTEEAAARQAQKQQARQKETEAV